MHDFTKEELDNMTLEDFWKSGNELQKEINKSTKKILEQFRTAKDFQKFKNIVAEIFAIHFQENMVDGFQKMYYLKRLENLEQSHNKLITIIIDESKKNNSISENTKRKLNDLEEEIKKNKKSHSLFGDVSLSLFKSSFTGMDLGD